MFHLGFFLKAFILAQLFKKDELVKLAHKLYSDDLDMSDEELCTLMMDTLFICLDFLHCTALL